MNIRDHLDRLEINKMKLWELDAGFALVIGLQTRVETLITTGIEMTWQVEVLRDGKWTIFSPTTSWEDFGFALPRIGIVIGTHEGKDDDAPRWFSAHAFLSGTTFYSRIDIRIAAARAATAYGRNLEWVMAIEPAGT